MIRFNEKYYSENELDEVYERAFSEGYEYAQREFGKLDVIRKIGGIPTEEALKKQLFKNLPAQKKVADAVVARPFAVKKQPSGFLSKLKRVTKKATSSVKNLGSDVKSAEGFFKRGNTESLTKGGRKLVKQSLEGQQRLLDAEKKLVNKVAEPLSRSLRNGAKIVRGKSNQISKEMASAGYSNAGNLISQGGKKASSFLGKVGNKAVKGVKDFNANHKWNTSEINFMKGLLG